MCVCGQLSKREALQKYEDVIDKSNLNSTTVNSAFIFGTDKLTVKIIVLSIDIYNLIQFGVLYRQYTNLICTARLPTLCCQSTNLTLPVNQPYTVSVPTLYCQSTNLLQPVYLILPVYQPYTANLSYSASPTTLYCQSTNLILLVYQP